ncbi:MAG: glutamate 5-kinase [Desulfobacterales bacterium]
MVNLRQNAFTHAKRIVVKVGSNVLTWDSGLNLDAIQSLSEQISGLHDKEKEIILVSSGAMASGIKKIGLKKRPDLIPQRQAAAAVGQAGLIMEYEKAFARYGKKVAQILLTRDDLSNRRRYLNARNTLCTLLAWKVVPIINENDTVMIEEIKFGDNDQLSAMITLLLDADLLINLTDIDGLFDKDPRTHKDAVLIPEITRYNKTIEQYAGKIPGALGTGGMLSKIKAAKKVTTAGVPMIIANGKKEGLLFDLFAGEKTGTFFLPNRVKMTSRKCWIGFNVKPKGTLIIDDGAATAILKRGKSLLPSGIVGVTGDFAVGSAVKIRKAETEDLGIGLVNYSAADIRKIMGLKTTMIRERLGEKTYDEIIHRNNLTVTDEFALEEK